VEVITEIESCRSAIQAAKGAGLRTALVPTMGALHSGHLALIQAARQRAGHVAVSIFVNPTQFCPGEDFAKYPRALEKDLSLCRDSNVDLVFAPSVDAMFPVAATTTVHVARLADGLCGPLRPGHFDGVATVVTKLFQILPVDLAVFGEKDYQQLVIVRHLARDLNVPVEIVGHPTVREPDGLALSSRNAYLGPSERRQAGSLSAALFAAVDRAAGGELRSAALLADIRARIHAAGPATIEYVEVVDAETLESLRVIDRPARICLAVRIGNCRLIDNVAVDGRPSTR
jgi:pantoate--beta-alanine ligase